ncbi:MULTISPECIES: RcnB family protein [Pseudomonas]|jgi:hypothetical protein|uniref:Nickel/cobalt transporter regulator n=1 Tax=Pseudomonas rhizophila TaxID=2045200 RepID=A0ABM6UIG1_9PSED|nr:MULTISPECIES: RcnB family protein [Pseudomonas]AVU77390.1 hypothetical protein CRX69_20240 [Pseudomonas rhizophila]MDD2034447.1 RcnB family protein [Pseudomonas sp. 39167]MXR30791.1 hypothetical protein [Pseudomonas sp. PICF6]QKJ36467.1 RcnB family protein [Pseudomonas sp. MPDS]
MRKPTLIASLVLIAGLGALGPVAQAVEATGDAVEHSPNNGRRLVEADRTPSEYQRSDKAIKNWKEKGLEAPEEGAQWVQIHDKYVMVVIASGRILKITPATR